MEEKPIISFEVNGQRITSEELQKAITPHPFFEVLYILGMFACAFVTVYYFIQ